jgi:hypothetical protein
MGALIIIRSSSQRVNLQVSLSTPAHTREREIEDNVNKVRRINANEFKWTKYFQVQKK